jgi:hypothetical protein
MTKWVIPDTPSPEAIDAHALVRAALERAAKAAENPKPWWRRFRGWARPEDIAYDIRRLASDPGEVAVIIMAAGEDRG